MELKTRKVHAELWTVSPKREGFESVESCNVAKISRGHWLVVAFDEMGQKSETFHEDRKADAFAVAEEWLKIDSNASNRAGKARTNAYARLPLNN